MDKKEINDKKWTRRSETFDNAKFNYFRLMQRELLNKLEGKAGYAYLDVGCGTGWAVEFLCRQFEEIGKFCGIDISAGMIETANKTRKYSPNIDFLQGDASSLPYENDSFDRILCTNSFHHYPDPQEAIQEIARVLLGGGEEFSGESLFRALPGAGSISRSALLPGGIAEKHRDIPRQARDRLRHGGHREGKE